MFRGKTWSVAALSAAHLLLATGASAATATAAYVTFDSSSRTWKLGNSQIERSLALDGSGRFLTGSFLQKTRGRDWAPLSLASSEFRLVLTPGMTPDAGEEIVRSGAGSWQLLDESRTMEADGTADLSIRLLSAGDGVAVTLHYQCYPEMPVIRTWLDVANEGDAPFTLTEADGVSLRVLGDGGTPSLFWVDNFTWGHADAAFQTNEAPLTPGSNAGFTTGPFGSGAAWFALRGTSGGDGLFGGWEWSGTGQFGFAADPAVPGVVSVGIGLAPGRFSHVLSPGDSFTVPAAFVGVYTGGWDDAAAATRRLVEGRFAPPLPDASFPWVGVDTWGYSLSIDEGLIHGLIDRAADLGAETFTLDAGWMERLGDWRPRSGAFDAGIAPLAEHAHARGLRFGIWMAFGVADPASDVVLAHPDWVATSDGVPIPADFGGVQLCLADPRVQAWVVSEIDRVVSEYGVDWLLHDFGVIAACTNPAHAHQAGDGEWATTAGYYAILDEVRRRHPTLVIENCWNGGSMFDFGMVRRHDTSNTSDKNQALASRQSVYGATYVLPPRYAGKYIGDDGTQPDYRFASGLPGGPFLLMGQITTWDAATTRAAADAMTLYKRFRPVLRDGSFYRLAGPPTAAGWDAFMSFDPATKSGVLLAYRGSTNSSQATLTPQGLAATDIFRLTCDTTLASGRLAAGNLSVKGFGSYFALGITLRIPDPFGAAVLTFEPASSISVRIVLTE
ncbi:MAG: alpha-galactosidase [Thermoanaerobaculia bacterium]